MKTKSITSIVALLGAVVTLNLSALAGPGPQPQVQTRSAVSQKSAAAPSSKKETTPTIGVSASEFPFEAPGSVDTAGGRVTVPTISTVRGPQGTHYIYRW